MRLNMASSNTKNLIYTSLCSYFGAASFGYTIGYSSPALPQMQLPGQPLEGNDGAAAWFGSIITLGALLGCPLGGWMLDKLGRKSTLLYAAVPYLVGWLAIWLGGELPLLYTGRFLTGLGSGIVCVVAPLYISETSTKELRGMLGSGVQLSVTVGIVLVYLLGTCVSWRHLALIGALIPVLAAALTLRAPETPQFLLNADRRVDAVRSLLWLRGNLASAEEECRDLEENAETPGDKQKGLAWAEFTKPELYRPLMVGCCAMLFQQLCGINVVMFYTVSIFQSAGFDARTSGQATVIIGVVQVVGTVLACFLMDRSGRRKLLILSGLGMAVTCAGIGAYYHHLASGGNIAAAEAGKTLAPFATPSIGVVAKSIAPASLGWLAVLCLVVYTLSFALGYGPIPMLLMSEIFPPRARGTACALVSFINWLLAFVVTNQFMSVVAVVGMHGTFWMFGGVCALGVVYVMRCVPETKGKSLEDIELYFLGRALRGI